MASGVSSTGQQANFLSDVQGTGQDVPADRELKSEESNGFNNLKTQDFVELLITQMQNQDPQNPMKQKEMMGQISQLTQLQQTQQLSDKISGISESKKKNNQFISILGANVNVTTSSGESHSGTLSKVSFKDGNTMIKVGGTDINSNNVKSIGVDTVN